MYGIAKYQSDSKTTAIQRAKERSVAEKGLGERENGNRSWAQSLIKKRLEERAKSRLVVLSLSPLDVSNLKIKFLKIETKRCIFKNPKRAKNGSSRSLPIVASPFSRR